MPCPLFFHVGFLFCFFMMNALMWFLRSLNGVIEQMEAFSHKLSDLSVRVENTQMNTSQEIELGARQREGQLRGIIPSIVHISSIHHTLVSGKVNLKFIWSISDGFHLWFLFSDSVLQERLTRQQKDMEEERNSLRMIITNMETRLSEQSRLLEQVEMAFLCLVTIVLCTVFYYIWAYRHYLNRNVGGCLQNRPKWTQYSAL